MQIRKYQSKAVTAAIQSAEINRTAVCVLPTGTGKTVIFAEIIRQIAPRRVIVLAHREELVFQAADKIKRFTGIQCGIEMADRRCKGNEPVICASTQTMRARTNKFSPYDFDYVIRDEAHHITAKTDRDIWTHFSKNPKSKLLGVTATPDRGDRQAIGQIFKKMAFEMSLMEALKEGWLVWPGSKRINLPGLDLSRARITAGDINQGDLSEQMERNNNVQAVANSVIREVGDRKTIVFTASVIQAKLIALAINKFRPYSAFSIDGNTKKSERRQLLKDFENNEYQYFVNCGIATEGYDCPDVSAIVMAKPTLVRSAYTQMVGRGLRVLPGTVEYCGSAELRKLEIERSDKKDCLVIDYTTNSTNHNLMKLANIFEGDMTPDEKGTSHILGNGRTIAQSNQGMWQTRGIAGTTSAKNLSRAGVGRLKKNAFRITAQKSIGMIFVRQLFGDLFKS